MHMMLHYCKYVRVATTFVDNANSVTLEIESDDGDVSLTLFDLPTKFTEAMKSLRDEWTRDHYREAAE